MTLLYAGIAWLLTMLVSLGIGFHYGAKNVQADWDRERVHIAQQSEQERTRIGEADKKSDKKASQRNEQRQTTQQTVAQGLIHHVQTIPDPVECWIEPSRVRNINAAFGFDTNTGNETATMPAASFLEKREPQRTGNMGYTDGLQLPAMQ